MRKGLEVCYVHDWLVNLGGAEFVLKEMIKIKPGVVYTLIFKEKTVESLRMNRSQIRAILTNKVPLLTRNYRNLLPLFPFLTKIKKINRYPLVITSSHAISNWFNFEKGQKIISYCHTPMRYIWTHTENYLNNLSGFKKLVFKSCLNYLRKIDLRESKKVSLFIAPSTAVRDRISEIYKREAVVIHPPVDVSSIPNVSYKKEDFYLFVGRLDIPYKKVDVLIRAFNENKRKLIIIGSGFDEDKLKSMAKYNIKFLGWKSKKEIFVYMKMAKALILPSEEDFGLVAVEAQGCGTPVIAFGKGGALDTVIPYKTGVFFHQQSEESLNSAIEEFEKVESDFNPRLIRENSKRFDSHVFNEKFLSLLDKLA